MPARRRSAIALLYDLVNDLPKAQVKWEAIGQSFIETVSEQNQHVMLDVSEHPNHIKVNAGWFPLRGMAPDVRECVKDYFTRMNADRTRYIYVGPSQNGEMLIISTHTLISKDPSAILEDYITLRHAIINEMQRLKATLGKLIEECGPLVMPDASAARDGEPR